jgi:hypothetical protein
MLAAKQVAEKASNLNAECKMQNAETQVLETFLMSACRILHSELTLTRFSSAC